MPATQKEPVKMVTFVARDTDLQVGLLGVSISRPAVVRMFVTMYLLRNALVGRTLAQVTEGACRLYEQTLLTTRAMLSKEEVQAALRSLRLETAVKCSKVEGRWVWGFDYTLHLKCSGKKCKHTWDVEPATVVGGHGYYGSDSEFCPKCGRVVVEG